MKTLFTIGIILLTLNTNAQNKAWQLEDDLAKTNQDIAKYSTITNISSVFVFGGLATMLIGRGTGIEPEQTEGLNAYKAGALAIGIGIIPFAWGSTELVKSKRERKQIQMQLTKLQSYNGEAVYGMKLVFKF